MPGVGPQNREVQDVKCPRCQARMTGERLNESGVEVSWWRCITCGEILDSVILENRQRPAGKRRAAVA